MNPTHWGYFSRFIQWLLAALACCIPPQLVASPVGITNSVNGAGIVLGVGTFESGSQITLQAVPQVDWQFDHWEGVPGGSATQNPIPLQVSPGLQPIAVMTSAAGRGRVTNPVGSTDKSDWERLQQEFGLPINQTNVFPQTSSVVFRLPDTPPFFDPGTTHTLTITESGQVVINTNALPLRGMGVAKLQNYSILTTGNWLVLTPAGDLVDVFPGSMQARPTASNPRWLLVGSIQQDKLYTLLDAQGGVSFTQSSTSQYTPTNVLGSTSGMAQIRFDPIDLNVEQGDDLLLAARIAPFDSLQWYKDGLAQPGLTNLCINQPIDASGTYQVLARHGTHYLAGTPTRVRVLPKGYPRVYVNDVEVPKSHTDANPVTVSIKSSFQGGQVFYTLDGSNPTVTSPRYTNSFTITNAVVKALSFSEDFSQSWTNDPVAISVHIDTKYALRLDWTGLGTVAANPNSGIYFEGEIVQVTAIPGAGWVFARWEGDVSGTEPVLQIPMLGNKYVKAVFEALPQFQITVTAAAGTTLGSGRYPLGTEIRIGMYPNAGWEFTGWAGSYDGTATNFPWTVTSNASFVARLATPITRVATGSGRIALDPDLPLYPFGTEVRVTPIAEPGSYQALWGGIGVGLPRGPWSFVVTNPTPRTTALFQRLGGEFVGLFLSTTAGGRVSQPNPEGIYPNGTILSLLATPDDGFEFAGWSGDVVGTNPELKLVLDQNTTVRANFLRRPVLTLGKLDSDGRLRLEFIAQSNSEVIVETSLDLKDWAEQFRLTGQGDTSPVRITLPPERDIRSRYWRLRRP